jgi:hypothetical protein
VLQTVFGEEIQTYNWFSLFKERQTSTEDKEHGQPYTSRMNENVERVREPVPQDRCLTIQECIQKFPD